MRKAFLGIFILVFFSILFGGSFLFWKGELQQSKTKLSQTKLGLVANEEMDITLLFAGDIMLDRGVEFYATQHNDWKWPFLLIADTLQKADLVFGNLESVISDKGENLGSIYSFRADPKALEGLTFAGFDILSVANNHSFDYGTEAFEDSASRLRKERITPIGIELFSATAENNAGLEIQEIQGTKIGFLAYTNLGSPLWQAPLEIDDSREQGKFLTGQANEKTPGVAWTDWYNLPVVVQKIQEAKTRVDILVVSLHAGEEYSKEPNEFQKAFAKSAINAGADLVVGHHPHVVQPVEYVCTQGSHICGWIAYSLGNFVFDQGFSPETMEGLLLEVKVAGKQITQVIPRVIRMNSSFQPVLQ